MEDYLDELASKSQDYAFELSESVLENPEMLYSSVDANGPGFGIVSASVALVGAAYLAYKRRGSDSVPNDTEEFWKATEELNPELNEVEGELEE